MSDPKGIPERYVVARGRNGTVECAVRSNGRMEAKEFLEDPKCRREKPALFALFQTIVNQTVDDDEVGPKRLKKSPCSEFVKGQVRIFCFRDGTAWVLTNGDLKKTQSTPKANIERAEQIMLEDLEIARRRKT